MRRQVEARSEELATLREFVGRWRAEGASWRKPLRSLTGGDEGAGPAVAPPMRRAAEPSAAGDHLGRLDRDRLATALAADDLQLDRRHLLDEEVRRSGCSRSGRRAGGSIGPPRRGGTPAASRWR
ncbi:MAG: hypothetical protein WKF75_00275 [Singulisphaera sp.]